MAKEKTKTKREKKKKASSVHGVPLTISSPDGNVLRTFSADTINSLRHMMTGLRYNTELPSKISVVAALQGEGVSHTALALGLTLANDLKERVCVVELNWWSPSMLKQIDPAILAVTTAKKKLFKKRPIPPEPALKDHPGVAQVIQEENTLEEALIPTTLPNLSLLHAGNLPLHLRAEIARSERLVEVLNQLSENFNYVVLDIPAILSTSDSIALASVGDACLIVARHGVTSITFIKRALDDLSHMKMLGVLLNQVKIHTPRWLHSLIPQE